MIVRGNAFGTGTTDLFKPSGKMPCNIDELQMSVITGASLKGNIFKILFGTISGPDDFEILIPESFL